MGKYANEFEEAIANVPYSTDWFEMRNEVIRLIVDVYHNQMPYFRSFQSTVDDAPNRRRCLVFEIFGEMYMYNEHFENGLIESGQLDRIVHLDDSWENCVAIVLYSNVVNAPPAAPMALKYYKAFGMYEIFPQLRKG